MQYNTIFFDIGNTLFFYNYDFLRDLLAQRFGVNLTSQEIAARHTEMRQSLVVDKLVETMEYKELWLEAYRRWLSALGIEEQLIRPISEAIHDHPFRHLFWSRTEEGTPEMLDWFRERGYRLGVISNAEGQIKRLVEHAGLIDRFDVIVDSGEVGFAKPDEKIFRHAMSSIGALPKKSIHVGDLVDADCAGAKKAGMTPILVDPEGLYRGRGLIKVKRAVDLPKLPMFK